MKTLILADENWVDQKIINPISIDVDTTAGNEDDSNTFELKVDIGSYDPEIKEGAIVYAPLTEYGGIIGETHTDTAQGVISFYGYTWRGYIYHKVVLPPSGSTHRYLSGDIQTILHTLIGEQFERIFVAPDEPVGVTVSNFKVKRYITLGKCIKDLLDSVGYKMQLQYVQDDPGYIEVRAVPIINYANDIEFSQDSKLHFRFKHRSNGINHMCCVGSGEGESRDVVNLYVQGDGSISETQYFFRNDEIAEIYDATNAEDRENLKLDGMERLRERMNKSQFNINVEMLDVTEVEIGDIVGGRDYITGLSMEEPILTKIWRQENGVETIEYRIEGEEELWT